MQALGQNGMGRQWTQIARSPSETLSGPQTHSDMLGRRAVPLHLLRPLSPRMWLTLVPGWGSVGNKYSTVCYL